MDGIRYSNYRLIPAIWASLAAPIALYEAPQPYPYVMAAGSVARSFAAVGGYLSAAWAALASGESHPAYSLPK